MIKKFFNSKTTLISFIIYILLTAFIFSQSLSSGGSSTEQSGRVSNVISNVVEFLSGNKLTLKDDGKIKELYPTSLEFSGADEELLVGKSYELTYKLLPENNYSLSEVEFSSSNESVVKIDKDGVLSACGVGTATVTLKDKFSNVSCEKEVTVGSGEYIPTITFKKVTGFSAEDNNVYYSPTNGVGAIYSIDFESEMEGYQITATNSDDYDIVLGNKRAYFYPKRAGEILITLTATFENVNGLQQKDYFYPINVLEKELPSYTTSLTLDKTELSILTSENKSLTLNYSDYTANLSPAQQRVFYVSDSRFLSVSSNGNTITLTPKKVGETTFSVYSVYNNSLVENKVLVSVLQGVPNSIKMVSPSGWAVREKELKLFVVGDGNKFNSNDFNWTVNGENASVENGKFLSDKTGRYTITATHKTIDDFTISKTIEVKYSFHTYVRKLVGHFSLFLVLAIFSAVVYYRLASILKPSKKTLLGTGLSLSAGFITASISELLQSGIFVSNRGPSVGDALLDFLGFIIGTAIYLIIYIIYRKVKSKKRIKN